MTDMSSQIEDDLVSAKELLGIIATDELSFGGGEVSHLHAHFNYLKVIHDIPQAHQLVWILKPVAEADW